MVRDDGTQPLATVMNFTEHGGRPGDERGFIHKKLLGAVSSLAGVLPIPGASIVSGITGRLAGARDRKLAVTEAKFGNGAVAQAARIPCRPDQLRYSDGHCHTTLRARAFHLFEQGVPDTAAFGGAAAAAASPRGPGVGDAVMGQYGAALEPGTMQIERSVCLPGMQLAKDGLCYNKGAITNSQRMWPRGRRPLLTGGDMRAIAIAARAGNKLERTTKRLRSLGMMKRLPAPRKTAHQHAKPVAAVSV